MIHVAVVDDESIAIRMISEELKIAGKACKEEMEILPFESAHSFLQAFNDSNINIDALFLDIDMPNFSGFELSTFLRDQQIDIPLVYITHLDDLMQNAFQYKALGFVRKSHLSEEIPGALRAVLKDIQRTSASIIVLSATRAKKTQYAIPVRSILYLESGNHQTEIHIAHKKECIITRETMSSFMSNPKFCRFILICSGIAVNLDFIFSIENNKLTLTDGEFFYISRRKQKSVEEAFLNRFRRPII